MILLTEFNFSIFSIVLSIVLFVFFLIFSIMTIRRGNKEKTLYLFTAICIVHLIVLSIGLFQCEAIADSLPALMSIMCLPLFVHIKSQGGFIRFVPLLLAYVTLVLGLAGLALFVPFSVTGRFLKFVPLAIMALLTVANWTSFFITSTDKKQIIRDGQPRTHLVSELISNYTMLLYFFLAVQLFSYFNNNTLWGKTMVWASFVGVILVCVMLLHSHITGKFVLFSKKWDDSVQTALNVCVAESKASVKADQTYRAIYERLVAYFEVEKPFLDADLTLMQVARKIYCNKLYLSKTICVYTGRNFCQFVNYHRIKHALKLYEEEPNIKINSWATMCGFRTVASFSMAFKLFVNESPGEWLKKTRELSDKF